MSVGQIALIIVLVSLNAFFVAVEFAMLTARRARLGRVEGLIENQAGSITQRWLDDETTRDRIIAGAQLGITLVSLALGAVGIQAFETLLEPVFARLALAVSGPFLTGLLGAVPLLVSLAILGTIHVVLGEQVPKVAVSRAPERFVLLVSPLMQFFTGIFRGYLTLLDWATRAILRLFGLPDNGNTHSAIISTEELKQMVSGPEVEGAIELQEREMISAVIEFSELVVRQISVPRTEIIAVEASTPVTEAIRIATQNGITKLPVYEDNLDQVIGILHLRDLLPALIEEGIQNCCARDLAREVLFVPESISVNDLLVNMRVRRQHLAITLDEFGGIAGLVTLEDLLEEIVGDVQDPFDVDLPEIEHMPDGSALVDGMALIEDVNHYFGLNLADSNYDTIAGYLLGKLGRIPQPGDTIEDLEQSVRFKVHAMERLRIARIHLSKL